MPTQWSEAEQVPLGYIAPPRPQARNSKASLCEAAQCSHWVVRRSVAEVARSAGGRDMLRQRRSIKLKGTFRAPARGTFALGGKSTQKRRQKLRFWISLRAFACCLSCSLFPRERRATQTSPKGCIVSASLFAAAFALKCKAIPLYASTQTINRRPLAATYLCRKAAKARFDNR